MKSKQLNTAYWIESEDLGVIDEPFNPCAISVVTKQPTISNLISRIQDGDLNLAPPFQRKEDLWGVCKQSRLIESILLHIPLPAFFFDSENVNGQAGLAKWLVVDGLQRLCSIRNFILGNSVNGKRLRLKDLEYLKDFEGLTFDQLPRTHQRTIEETQITANIIQSGTPPEVKFNIFKRVNTGGLPLNHQEIRHALNQGRATDLLKELAESKHFVAATAGKVKRRRMQDREFVNRYLAFRLMDLGCYREMDSFMNEALKFVNERQDLNVDMLKTEFYEALDALHCALGELAFCRCKTDGLPSRKINKALFEALTVSLSKRTTEEMMRFRDSSVAREEYIRLFASDGRLSDLVGSSTGARARIVERYDVIEDYIQRVIGVRG